MLNVDYIPVFSNRTNSFESTHRIDTYLADNRIVMNRIPMPVLHNVKETTTGLNSTWPTQVVRRGKLDTRSDSPARHTGGPANSITIILFNLDIKTLKIYFIFLIFMIDVISEHFSRYQAIYCVELCTTIII